MEGLDKMTPKLIETLFNELRPERKREKLPKSVIDKVIKDINKIKKIPYKKKDWKDLFWSKNPYENNGALTIDIPRVEIKEVKNKDWKGKVVFYTPERCVKEGFKFINKSCVITHNGEILAVYIKGETDDAVNVAVKSLRRMIDKVEVYYPVKEKTFYSGFKLTRGSATEREKKEATYQTQSRKEKDKYQGKNWLDGMIKYFKGTSGGHTGTIVTYQPREVDAIKDKEFLYDLVYSYGALHELEKRYSPAIANYRYELAKNANFPSAFPNFPLEKHPATTCGSSVDFASAIHNDSGLEGVTESIIWNKCREGEHQFFVSPDIKIVFDLSKDNALILQPPKIAHGTINTGNHGGIGIVNITKENLVNETELNKLYYSLHKKYSNTH